MNLNLWVFAGGKDEIQNGISELFLYFIGKFFNSQIWDGIFKWTYSNVIDKSGIGWYFSEKFTFPKKFYFSAY